jgi:RHS repeat-associated protein
MRKNYFINPIVTILLLIGGLSTAVAQNTVKPTVKAPNGFDVNSFTGNLYHQRADMKMPAQGIPMEIVFSYNNTQRNKDWGYGRGWTFTYNVAYTVDSTGNITVLRADGRRNTFRKMGTTYKAPAGAFDTLAEYQAGKFRLDTKEGWSYFFDVASHRKLTKVQDRNNNAITISYTDSLPSAITDAAGRSFSLTWDNGKLKEIQNTCASPVRKIAYAYDTAGNPIKVMRPDSSIIKYYYDDNSRIIGFTDELGNNMSITYNGNGAVSKIVSCATTQLFTYSPQTRKTFVTEQVQGQRQITTYSYDTTGRIIHKEGNCCGYNVTYQYDANNNVTGLTNGNNQTTKYEYDAKGNVIKETDAEGFFITYTWHPTLNRVLTVKDKRGNTTTYEYDAAGNQTKIIKPLGITEVFTYDSKGNMLTHKDGNNNTTTYEYNTSGLLTKTTDALNGVVTNTYDGCGNLAQVKDARNNITSYEYDLQNRITKITNAMGGVTKNTYDVAGNLTSVTDALNRTSNYQYDGLDRRIKTISPLGNTLTIDYDERGNKIREVDARGNGTTYTYNSRNQVLTERDALGKTKKYEYDGVGNLISETDKMSNTTRYEYNGINLLIKETNAAGNSITTTYDQNGNKISTTDYNGNIMYFQYDALNRMTQITDAYNKTITFSYDNNDNVLNQKDKNGNIWSTEYDKLNRPVKKINPLTFYVEFNYDPNGNKLTDRDPLGHITTYTYDALNRLLQQTNPLNESTTNTYDAVGNLKTTTYVNENIVTNIYDNDDRLVSVSDPISMINTYTYDATGNKITETDANSNTVTYVYDELNRVISITDPASKKVINQYDANNNLTSQTDRNNSSKYYEYDKLNRIVSETNALNYRTIFDYDANGNRVRIVDAKNNITSYSYDALNRLVKETYADGSRKEYTYDAHGNQTTRRDQNGSTTSFQYNSANLLLQRIYSGGATEQFTYDAAGHRLTATNTNAIIEYTYDNVGRLTSEKLNGKETRYTYNTANLTRTITYPGGRTIIEKSDYRDRLLNIKDGALTISEFIYDAADRITTKTLGNGISLHYEFDNNNRITRLNIPNNNTLDIRYVYDNENHRLSVTNLHRNTHSETYHYDKAYNLTGYYRGKLTGSGLTDTISKNWYTYDAVFNRINSREDNFTNSYSSNNMNAYTQIVSNGIIQNYSYDKNGNTKQDEHGTYQYDEENRLTAINGNHQFLYDAIGRKVKSINNGTIINYYYAGYQVIEERDGADNLKKSLVYGIMIDDLISFTADAQTYYVTNDLQGSVLALYQGNTIIERYDYHALGYTNIYNAAFQPLSSSSVNNLIAFHGRDYIASGIYNFRSRTYHTTAGRFGQRDPIGYLDGMNLYHAYFLPNLVDPFGKTCSSISVSGSALKKLVNPILRRLPNVKINFKNLSMSFSVCEEEECCSKKTTMLKSAELSADIGASVELGSVSGTMPTLFFGDVDIWLGIRGKASISAGGNVSFKETCDKSAGEGCLNVTLTGALELGGEFVWTKRNGHKETLAGVVGGLKLSSTGKICGKLQGGKFSWYWKWGELQGGYYFTASVGKYDFGTSSGSLEDFLDWFYQ